MSAPADARTGLSARLTRLLPIVSLVTLAAAAAVRWLAALTDLWLDEIRSLTFAEDMTSPLDVVLRFHHDNNHALNTLWLWIAGPRAGWLAYRAPALLAGIATVGLLLARPRHRPAVERLVAGGLAAGSFMMVLLSSEARGYSLAGLIALAAYLTLDAHLRRPRTGTAVGFVLLICAGFLAHLTFLYVYAGLALWSVTHIGRAAMPRPGKLAALAALHGFPTLFLAFLYVVHVRPMVVGGGPPFTIAGVVFRTLCLVAGLPESVAGGTLVAAVLAALLVTEWRRGGGPNGDAPFFVGVFLAPAVLLLARRPEHLDPRYFFLCVPFALVLAGRTVARAFAHKAAFGWASIAVVLACLAGNGVRIAALLDEGRGRPSEAVRFMAEHTAGDEVTVGSDHDFRNRLTLAYHARYLPAGKRLVYRGRNEPGPPPEWFIAHATDPAVVPRETLRAGGTVYRIAATYRHSGHSGLTWFVYKQLPPGAVLGPADGSLPSGAGGGAKP